ncbi:YceI family protein [Paremcibacter congregatus]|uniref:YceI family protein n=1 Tax=Paremcibacter congregatus TaxID=2043170 RepID=UPI0030ED3F7D
MRRFVRAIILLGMMTWGNVAHAETGIGREVYQFDQSHTNIMWFADHIGYSQSMGQFMDFDGEIILDHDQPEQSSVRITINTASIMTGLPKFDAHLKSADFFDVEKHPTATFVSKEVILLGENKAKVKGEFTLLGHTKPLVLTVRLNKRGMDIQRNIHRTGFSVITTVKRSLWGMKSYLPFVGDEVKIKIEAEALIKQ